MIFLSNFLSKMEIAVTIQYTYRIAYCVKEIKYRQRWWFAATYHRDRFDLGFAKLLSSLFETSPANYFGYSCAYAWMSIGHAPPVCQSVVVRV